MNRLIEELDKHFQGVTPETAFCPYRICPLGAHIDHQHGKILGMAIDLLLSNTPKNRYVKSGNNAQGDRKDLPLYLPGNESLLLAIPLLVAGVEKKPGAYAGFHDDGTWCVKYEDIRPFPL